MADRPSDRATSEFVSEAQETIEALDKGLVQLYETRTGEEPDPDILNAVFRAAHTLKGLSAMAGVERMTQLAHALEDCLDDLRMGRRGLDPATLDLLLAAPGLFGRIIGEEAEHAEPTTTKAAAELAASLREAEAPVQAPSAPEPSTAGEPAPPAGIDSPKEVTLGEVVSAVLTEYEDHRLSENIRKGLKIYRVRARFELATFDTGLDELKKKLKPKGEVVATLPSTEMAEPDAIAFDVLFASKMGTDETTAFLGAGFDLAVVRPPSPTPPPPAPAPVAAAPGATSEVAREVVERPAPVAAPPEPPAAPPLRPQNEQRQVGPPHPLRTAATSVDVDASLRSVSKAVRVDIQKLDRLMNLVGELVLVKTSMLGIANRLRSGEESSTIGLELQRESRSLDRKLNELQGGIIEVRMVPLGQIFDKLSRMVRKVSRDLGREIDFQVEGGEVEVDKLIVEELSDPLMHLIRNSIDHGIESPEVRAAAGKPTAGWILVSAVQKGNHVVISVSDDGAGIDDKRIRKVAVERGVASAEAVAALSRRDALNLIFVPGFSTASEVTALSGRGVGMDVVKSNVASMSGIIDLHTEVGRGTKFEITLPVTLAIIRALVVTAANRTYAIPLNSVLEIVNVNPTDLTTIELREVMLLRDSTIPLVRLGPFLGSQSTPLLGAMPVVVVGLAQMRLGIAVDAMVGQQDIVVKPLGRVFAGVRGIAGATDLGARRTVLVLDVSAIIEDVMKGERPQERRDERAPL